MNFYNRPFTPADRVKSVAIVHDQLYTIGGAEKVLKHICDLFPNADVFVLYDILSEDDRKYIMGNRVPKSSFIGKLPFIKRLRKIYFFLMPLAVEQFNLKKYDLVISSSYLVAKGIIPAPNQTHVCYLHSPMRYAWDQKSSYVKQIPTRVGRIFGKLLLHYMRSWDVQSSTGVDKFIANSRFVANRAVKAYRRPATVVYPPVETELFGRQPEGERPPDSFVTMSRLAEGKRIDLLLDVFRLLPGSRLRVIGDGALRASLEAAAPPNVTFLGYLPDEQAAAEIARASAFVYVAEEDFGIAPVEAQAAGTPVVAYRSGGTAETVRDLDMHPGAPTGVFFEQQTPEAIAEAVTRLKLNREAFRSDACRANASRFAAAKFQAALAREISSALPDGAPRAADADFDIKRASLEGAL